MRANSRQLTTHGQPSQLPATLIEAYRNAVYTFRWLLDEEVELNLDQSSEYLEAIFNMTGAMTTALITAANPLGVALPDDANAERKRALKAALDTAGWHTLPATGRDPAGLWPAEHGYLVVGPSWDEALAFGTRFEQNALIWSDEAFMPRLVLLH